MTWAVENGIKWVYAGPGTPKTQGKAERGIRSIKRSIAKVANQDNKAWKGLLQATQFSFNTKIGSMGFSPFQLLYGYQPRLAVENLIMPTTFKSVSEEERYQLVILKNEKLDEICHLAIN